MSQQNIEIVQSAYAAFGRGDLDGVIATLDENIEWKTPGGPDFPTAGNRRGRAQVREFFRVLLETMEIEHFEPHTFIADGDRVVVLGTDKVRVKGGSKTISEDWCHVLTFKNGKTVAFQEYLDTAAVAAELKTAGARA